MSTITQADIDNGKRDLDDLGLVINGATDLNGTGTLPTRGGGTLKTLAKLEIETNADRVAAAASAQAAADSAASFIGLPALAGNALKAPRANAAEDNVEFATVTQASWDLLDDADAAAQRVTLGVAADSADADLSVDPDAALRRDIAVIAISTAIAALNGVAAYSVNFDISGTAAIDESFNVASITDISSGVTEIGFTNNFDTALYRTANARRGTGTSGGQYAETLQMKTAYAYSTSAVGLLSGTVTPSSAGLQNRATNHSTGFGTLA